MSDNPFISQYSPQWTKPEYLEAILVQRDGLIRESVDLIRESVLTDNKHHLLFVGPRGIGKTHLVKLIYHRLSQRAEEDPALKENLRFAWLNEDEIATSFLRLLLNIYRTLSERYPEEFPAGTLTGIIGKDPTTARELLGQALLRDLRQRTIVLMVENLDALFKAMPEAELKTWRAFVQNHPVFATVATAQMLFDGVSDRDEPFFGFFDTRHLESLSVDEARHLLENIARLHPDRTGLQAYLQTPQGRSRVSAIHELSGGNPRLFVIFSELFTQEQDMDGLVRPFEEMVDRQLTSFYQERLRWLSPQQREIIQLLSRTGHPVPVKHIADGLFTTHNSITGQLKQLREMRYLNFRQNGREVLYELAEPLMRLALQVKETHDRRPLALIVDFLRVAFEREEIEHRLATCDPASRSHAYYASAKAAMDLGLPNPRHEILRYQLENLPPDQCDDGTLATVRCAAEDLDEATAWIRLGLVLLDRKEWEEAVQVFTRVIGMEKATPAEVAKALHRRGNAHSYAGRPEAAITDYSRVIELPGAPAEPVARALTNRGVKHGQAGRTEEAIADYTRAIELPGAPAKPVAWALYNRGVTHGQAGRTEEEIADYTRAIELPGAPAEQVASALNNRGFYYDDTGRPDSVLRDFSSFFAMPDRAAVSSTATAERLTYITQALVKALFSHSSDAQQWMAKISEFLGHFARYNGLTQLGDALVQHLPELATSPLNHAAWDAWADCWEKGWAALRPSLEAADRDRLEIPLRLLRTGIDYLKNKQENRLLVLPMEERRHLRKVLGLPAEKN